MKCDYCKIHEARPRGRFCSKRCRQAGFRIRLRRVTSAAGDVPMRACFLDPPYIGLSKRYYGDQESYAGEVDHVALIAETIAAGYDGWALSCSMESLREILPLCPAHAHVCPWVKPIGVPPATYGLHTTWEPLIVVGGRQERPGKRDWLRAQPARGWGDLPGRKPLAFCAWLFACLGMRPGDTLVDRFPGTGGVARAWAELSRTPGNDAPIAAPPPGGDTSPEYSEPRNRRSAAAGRVKVASPGQLTLLGASPSPGDTREVARG